MVAAIRLIKCRDCHQRFRGVTGMHVCQPCLKRAVNTRMQCLPSIPRPQKTEFLGRRPDDPTEEQIREHCLRFQAQWSPEERAYRRRVIPKLRRWVA